ncbi:type II toxin-antitoxin system RelE family toxin [Bacillus sp. FSL K6-3431]|uniref:type II toxin-antitoxin system RelE family toxin n=1 Tax=Bacillus sp. FSL K6-3431 TaxID=2921500 RepID=UPI0030F8BED7
MYKIIFSKKSNKFITKQDKNTKIRIKENLLKLAENPYDARLNDIKPLKGFENIYRKYLSIKSR